MLTQQPPQLDVQLAHFNDQRIQLLQVANFEPILAAMKRANRAPNLIQLGANLGR